MASIMVKARRANGLTGVQVIRPNSIVCRASPAIIVAAMWALGVSLQGAAAPGGRERVTFRSADSSVSASIPATVFRPAGAGPFPGLVALHGCDGIGPWTNEWAAWLQTQGYLTIVPDSLSPRHLSTTCGTGDLTPGAQARDGLGALAYLRNRPDIIATKVGVMGWSHGGAATLVSASVRFMNGTKPEGGGYQAAIAFYPACGAFQEGGLATPLLMLLGSADDWQPPTHCIERGTALQAAGAPVTMTVYPGATHAFDVSGRDRVRNVPNHGTVHLRYDPTAAADSQVQVQRFLRIHLQ